MVSDKVIENNRSSATAYSDSGMTDSSTVGLPNMADDWIAACNRLQELPTDYEPQAPYFNLSALNFSAVSGCGPGEMWTACIDSNQRPSDRLPGDRSCYTDDNMMILPYLIPSHYAYPIYGLIFPALVFLAVIANVFVLLVLSKRHMQSPTNIVLLYMAVADLTVGIVPLPFTFYWFTLRNYSTPWRLTPSWCYVYHYLMDALPPICHNVAIWLTVLLAAQRYVCIEFPVRAQVACTIQNVKRASIILVVISIICGSMKFGDSGYKTYRGYAIGQRVEDGSLNVLYAVGVCLSQHSSLVRSIGYQRYYDTHFWIRAVIFIWLPSILLICLNALLIRAIKKAQRRRERLLSESRNREANRQKESNSTTMMLIMIVSIFLVVNGPQALLIAIFTINNKLELNLSFLRDESDVRGLFLMIDNMLIIATYPINFAIYCSMSTQFRDTFKHLFCPSSMSESAMSRRTSSYYGYTLVSSTMNNARNGSMKGTTANDGGKYKMAANRQRSKAESDWSLSNKGEHVSDTCM